jgi:hypothetical protein
MDYTGVVISKRLWPCLGAPCGCRNEVLGSRIGEFA